MCDPHRVSDPECKAPRYCLCIPVGLRYRSPAGRRLRLDVERSRYHLDALLSLRIRPMSVSATGSMTNPSKITPTVPSRSPCLPRAPRPPMLAPVLRFGRRDPVAACSPRCPLRRGPKARQSLLRLAAVVLMFKRPDGYFHSSLSTSKAGQYTPPSQCGRSDHRHRRPRGAFPSIKDRRPRGEDDPFQTLRGQRAIPILRGFLNVDLVQRFGSIFYFCSWPFSASF
jgi:hypothetical protein